jgi:hypothetical protein
MRCRHDERALFGALPESVHIPLETLLFALPAEPQVFEELTGAPRPEANCLLVFHSRKKARAELAALVARENGMATSTKDWKLRLFPSY